MLPVDVSVRRLDEDNLCCCLHGLISGVYANCSIFSDATFKTTLSGFVLKGPIAGVLIEHYGCRLAGMLGGVLSTTSLLCSYWVTSIGQMYLMAITIGGNSC